jgi:hypothetical protein
MNLVQSLAALAVAPLLAGPALAGGCVKVVRKVAAVKVRTVIKREFVAVPYAVDRPVYVAQNLPSPSVNYTITVPPPPAAPVQQYPQKYAPAMPSYAPPQAPAYAPPQADCGTPALLQLLQKIDARLQALERAPDPNGEPEPAPPKKNGKPAPPDPFNPPEEPQSRARPGRAPSSLTGGCARCHSDQTAQQKGAGFVLWSQGQVPADVDLDLAIEKVQAGHMPPPDNEEGIPPLTERGRGTLVAFFQAVKQARAGQ